MNHMLKNERYKFKDHFSKVPAQNTMEIWLKNIFF